MGLPADRGSLYARPSSRGCWYYLRYFFLFVSLIQFLVILGLVLFMVYGNVHLSTEEALQVTERRAQSLHGQVLGLAAARTNLTKELNLTARAKDNIMQMLLGVRRELDRINTSYRQCQTELETYQSHQHIMAAIILSQKQCEEQLRANNQSCNALLLKFSQRTQALEADAAKTREQCAGDKGNLVLGLRAAQAEGAACEQKRAQAQQELGLARDELQNVRTLCVPLEKDKFQSELLALWKDTIIPRTLNTVHSPFGFYANPELSALRLTCDQLPSVMATRVEELARSLRAGIERVTRENAELQRQKLRVEEELRASQEARDKAEKEVHARENRVRAEWAQQTQQLLQEKTALQKERDGLAQALAQRRQEAEELRLKLAVSQTTLDTCLRAKSQFMAPPRTAPAPPQPPSIKDINPVLLEEFKKKILESQGLTTSRG